MATPMTTAEKARFVLPILRRVWDQEMNAVLSPAMQFFDIQSSTTAVEYSQGLGAFGLVPEYNSATAEQPSATIHYDTFAELYEKTFTHKEYAAGFAIERKLIDDDQSKQILKKGQALGLSFGRTRASHAASVFNNAFSSSYLGADGKALSATDHPVNKTSATTFSNKTTSALSYASVVAGINAGQSLDDDRGNPLPAMYNVLLVPIALQATAYEITKALAKPGTADNDANFLTSAGLQVVVDPWLSDANNWFLIDSAQARQHLIWFNRVNPEFEIDPTSDYNLQARYRGYMRHSFGWDDARWIYGAEVA
jgi:phage major head subunit gpT-like protein